MTSNNLITICHSSYAVIKKLATGGFASVYTAKKEDNTRKALKIQNPPYLWEVAITEELHKRLQANDLMVFVRL
jgi:S-formylglutathione hydrolase FrmB